MKTLYVLVLIFFASATVLFGLGALIYEGNSMLLVQAVFNVMLAAGALVNYRKGV